jgi:hypothetical protein
MMVVMNLALSLLALLFLHNAVQSYVSQQQLVRAKKTARQYALSRATRKNLWQ